jgi:hypothetical protein
MWDPESIHFLGVLRRELLLLATSEIRIPSLKGGAQLVIEDIHANPQ